MIRRPPRPTAVPYTPLFRSRPLGEHARNGLAVVMHDGGLSAALELPAGRADTEAEVGVAAGPQALLEAADLREGGPPDRKSTRLNSSHANISYAVFCLKKKN